MDTLAGSEDRRNQTGGIRRGLALGFGVEIGVAALYPMPPVVRIAFERGDGEESGR